MRFCLEGLPLFRAFRHTWSYELQMRIDVTLEIFGARERLSEGHLTMALPETTTTFLDESAAGHSRQTVQAPKSSREFAPSETKANSGALLEDHLGRSECTEAY
jgi:hypothetical protein